jgi:hypothetical protein
VREDQNGIADIGDCAKGKQKLGSHARTEVVRACCWPEPVSAWPDCCPVSADTF